MTKTELKEKLDELGIEYDSDALKEELESLLEAASPAKDESTGNEGTGSGVESEVKTTDTTTIETVVSEAAASIETAMKAIHEVNADFHTCFKQMISGLPFKKEE